MKTRPGLELTAAGRTRNEGECRRCSRAKGCYVATNMETISPRLSHFGWLTCAPIVPPTGSSCRAAFKLSLQRWNTGCISPSTRVAFSASFFSSLSLSARPGVNFLSRPVSDPEHSLPHSNRRHRSPRLRPPAPPLDGRVPRAAIIRSKAQRQPGGCGGPRRTGGKPRTGN